MTTDEWRERYFNRICARGFDKDEAAEIADIAVESQQGFVGPSVDHWDNPEDAADDDMLDWGD